VLGKNNLDAPSIGIDAQCHVLLQKMLSEFTKKKVIVRKLAFEAMGLSRLWSWYEITRDKLRPQIVFLGISTSAFWENLPAVWSVETGFSQTHPPGDYLAWDSAMRDFVVVKQSPEWAARQMRPRETDHSRMGNHDFAEALYSYVIGKLRADDILPVLFLEELDEKQVAPRWVAELAKTHGVPYVNTYAAFANDDSGLPPCDDSGSWNFTGHRLAAAAAFQVLTNQPIVSSIVQRKESVHANV